MHAILAFMLAAQAQTSVDFVHAKAFEHADQRMTQACGLSNLLGPAVNNPCLCMQRELRQAKDAVIYAVTAEVLYQRYLRGRSGVDNKKVLLTLASDYGITPKRLEGSVRSPKLAAAKALCKPN